MGEGRLQRRADGARSATAERHRDALAIRLRERQPEIRRAIATRVYSISDPRGVTDPAYLQSLDGAVTAAVDLRLAVLEVGEGHASAVPPPLLAQARLDARDGVPLDTVLRRYVAGNALFGDFLVEEAERAEVPSSVLRRLLAAQSTLGDELITAVSAEHTRETESRPSGTAERRRECVKRLLAGELADHSDLAYDLDAHHLALIARGEEAEGLLRRLAATLDRRLLAVRREEEPVWAVWLGGTRALATADALRVLVGLGGDSAVVAVGEPGEGLSGWRLSHFQAKAALSIAERNRQPVVRYADVALLAAVVRDEVAAASLHQLYLAPLERTRDGGGVARETLRAYFAAERNITSTAASLGVDRRTVRNRIDGIEELLGRSLQVSAADLEIALRLAD